MVNVLYDFTDAFGPGYTPYIGAGVGWQYIRESNLANLWLAARPVRAPVNPTGSGSTTGRTPSPIRRSSAWRFHWRPGFRAWTPPSNTASWAPAATGPTRRSSSPREWPGARTSRSARSTTTPSWWACATPSMPRRRPRRRRGRHPAAGPRGRPHLPGLLRLGPRRPHPARPPGHLRGGAGHDPRAGHADPGQRLHRPVRHAALQPGPLGPPRAERGQRAGP